MNNQKGNAPMDSFYIDGTIDTIELMTGRNTLKFSLLPSADFLKTVAEGEKKALFIRKDGSSLKADAPKAMLALLENVSRNEHEKEVLVFDIENKDSSLKCLLLEAKNNRNTVRVVAQSTGKALDDLHIAFSAPVSIAIL